MSLGIVLPGRAIEYRCHCGAEFLDRELGKRHAIRCASEADDYAQETIAPFEELITPLDQEAWKWGRKRISEGRVGFRRGRAA